MIGSYLFGYVLGMLGMAGLALHLQLAEGNWIGPLWTLISLLIMFGGILLVREK